MTTTTRPLIYLIPTETRSRLDVSRSGTKAGKYPALVPLETYSLFMESGIQGCAKITAILNTTTHNILNGY